MNGRAGAVCVALSFAAAAASYVASAPHAPGVWDVAELQAVPYILGIAHPTGFPLFTLGGWLFTHALAVDSVAWRMNVFSGLCLAGASASVALIALTLGAGVIEAFLGSLLFAWSGAAWNKGTHADPHAMSLLFVVLLIAFALRYARGGAASDLIAACACAGLGLATHPEVLYSLPAIGVALVVRGRLERRVAAVALAALVLPLALYAYLPLRSAYVAAHGLDPNAAPPISGTVFSEWDTNHTRTLAGFIDEVSGRQFGAAGALAALFDARAYPAAAAFWWRHANEQLPLLALGLAALGAAALAARDVRSAAIVAAGTLGALPFVNAYQTVEGDVDRYLLPSFALIAALAALASRLPIPRVPSYACSIVVCVLLLGAVNIQFQTNRSAFDFRHDTGGQGAIDTVRSDIPDGAIVVTTWVDATALSYGAFVDRSLGSRIIVAGWPGEFTDRYRAWGAVKPVFIFADPNTMGNVQQSLRRAWLTDRMGSDGYHHIVRVVVPPDPPRRRAE